MKQLVMREKCQQDGGRGVSVCEGMIVPAENTQRVLFPPSDRRLRPQPRACCAKEMTVQISKALPKQPGVPETTKALIIILWHAILYLSQDV